MNIDLIQDYINSYKDILGDNLVNIIQTGSSNSKKFIEGWSDLDFVLVLNNIDFLTLQNINTLNLELEKKYNIHLGTSPISLKEYINNYSLSSKIALIKLNFKINLSKIIYGDNTIYDYKLENISKDFCLREFNYYKDLLRVSYRDGRDVKVVKSIIKSTEYLLLFACLYNEYLPVDMDEKIEFLRNKYSKFDNNFENFKIVTELKNEYVNNIFNKDKVNIVANEFEIFVRNFYNEIF